MATAMRQWLPVSEVSYPLGLSCLLHGFLAVVVVYAPPWFGAKPFKIPVSYEVTLVTPSGGGTARASPSTAQRPKAAAGARAKTAPSSRARAAAPRSVASRPRDVLTLPPSPARPVAPRPAVQPLPAPARSEELTVPATRASAKRPTIQLDAVPPAAPPVLPAKSAVQAAPASPPVAPIVAPIVTPPPSLALAKPAPVRPPVAPPSPPSVAAPRAVVAPKVAAPPAIAQPVITPPVVMPPRVRAPVLPVSPPEIDTPTLAMAPDPVVPSIHGGDAGLSLGEGEHGADLEPGVFVGNTDPALAYYFVLIQDKISSHWTPPKIPAGATATVNVSLRVLRSGQIRELGVNASSGDRLVDDSAVRAVRLSSPLPPLPTLFTPEALSLQLRFTLAGVQS
jgi:TonB family protein